MSVTVKENFGKVLNVFKNEKLIMYLQAAPMIIKYLVPWKKIARVCAAVFGTSVTTTAYLYYRNPKVIIQALIWWGRRQCGLTTKFIKDSRGFRFCYAEAGVRRSGQPTMVFLPGLGGTIENWVPVIKHLSKTRHMIALEMPGGGMTTCELQDTNILTHIDRLKQFLSLLKLDTGNLHLVGAATGATTVGCYAARYPDSVTKLTMICPAMRSEGTSEVIKLELAGLRSGLVPDSPADLARTMEVVSYRPKPAPYQLLKGVFDLRKKNLKNAENVGRTMLRDIWQGEKDLMLGSHMHNIQAPTQIVWGEYDRISHISGIDLLQRTVPKIVRVDIVTSGHALYVDQPKKLAALLEAFSKS